MWNYKSTSEIILTIRDEFRNVCYFLHVKSEILDDVTKVTCKIQLHIYGCQKVYINSN